MSNHSNPYAPPTTASLETSDAPRRTRWTSSWTLLGLSVAVFAATLGLLVAFDATQPGIVGFGAASLVAFIGTWAGIRRVWMLTRATATVPVLSALLTLAAIAANLLMAGAGALAALMSTTGFRRGRQIRRFGRVLLPRVTSGASWARLDLRASDPAEDTALPLPDRDRMPRRTAAGNRTASTATPSKRSSTRARGRTSCDASSDGPKATNELRDGGKGGVSPPDDLRSVAHALRSEPQSLRMEGDDFR